METFILLSLVLIPLLLGIFFFSLKKGGSNKVKLPPGTSGWPLLGESIEFRLLGPQKFIANRMKSTQKTYSKPHCWEKKLQRSVVQKGTSSWLPKSLALILFAEFFENSSRKLSTSRLSFQYNNLKHEVLKQYIPVMDQAAREHIEKGWAPNQEVKVFPLMKKYTFSLACLIFMNIEDAEKIKKLAGPSDIVSKGLRLSLPINLPGFAIKAGRVVCEELVKIMRERKKKLMENKEKEVQPYSLTQMLLYTDEDGQFMSEIEIGINIMGLLLANYESTSNAVTCVLKHIAELPHIYDEVFKEMMAIANAKGPDELPNWEDIEKMNYSWNVARESLRLTPPSQGAFRVSMADFTYAGFIIPKGWKVFWNVNTTHKNPKYFPDTEKFHPTRFEGSGPAPYTDRHSCPLEEGQECALGGNMLGCRYLFSSTTW